MAEYLVFGLGRDEFGIGIRRIREIRTYGDVTALPAAPAYLKGFINLRGLIVPVVDLRVRMGCPEARFDAATTLVILETGGRLLGVVVDAVSDVVRLGGAAVRPPQDLDGRLVARFVSGIGVEGTRMIMLLDVDDALGVHATSAQRFVEQVAAAA